MESYFQIGDILSPPDNTNWEGLIVNIKKQGNSNTIYIRPMNDEWKQIAGFFNDNKIPYCEDAMIQQEWIKKFPF